MKKVLVAILWLCCVCAVHAQSFRVYQLSDATQKQSAGVAQMSPNFGSVQPSAIHCNAAEHLYSACQTSFSNNHTSVQAFADDFSTTVGVRNVSPTRPPNEPMPVGEGWYILFALAILFAFRKLFKSKNKSHSFPIL